MGEQDRILRALGRVKKEAEESPILIQSAQESRNSIQFYVYIIGSCAAVITAIITATAIVVSYKTDITQNKTDVAALKAEVAVVKVTAERVEGDFNRARPVIEKDHELIVDVTTQREYGISNKEWSQRKYGYAAPSLGPTPVPQPAPTPR